MPTTRPTLVGKDQHRYEVIDDWAKLPAGKEFGNTHGVCETADGRIFIHNASPTGDCVCEFDPDGKFIRSWGKEFSGGAHGNIIEAGNIVSGTDEFIVPFVCADAKGQPLYQANEKHTAEQRYAPTNIAFAPGENGGDFYVADGYGSNFIHQYNGQGKYIRSWGGTGSDVGQLKCPHGIWCDTRNAKNPMIVVADRSNVRLQYFTLDGKYVSMISDELRAPCHFDQRGSELLIPDLKGREGMCPQYPKRVEITGLDLKASRLHFLGAVGGWAWPFGGESNKGLPAAVS